VNLYYTCSKYKIIGFQQKRGYPGEGALARKSQIRMHPVLSSIMKHFPKSTHEKQNSFSCFFPLPSKDNPDRCLPVNIEIMDSTILVSILPEHDKENSVGTASLLFDSENSSIIWDSIKAKGSIFGKDVLAIIEKLEEALKIEVSFLHDDSVLEYFEATELSLFELLSICKHTTYYMARGFSVMSTFSGLKDFKACSLFRDNDEAVEGMLQHPPMYKLATDYLNTFNLKHILINTAGLDLEREDIRRIIAECLSPGKDINQCTVGEFLANAYEKIMIYRKNTHKNAADFENKIAFFIQSVFMAGNDRDVMPVCLTDASRLTTPMKIYALCLSIIRSHFFFAKGGEPFEHNFNPKSFEEVFAAIGLDANTSWQDMFEAIERIEYCDSDSDDSNELIINIT
jgi:hypothetical protein